jgi:DoxX-like family
MLVSLLLAALLTYAAVRKLSHRPEVVATYTRVGVPEERLDQLAWLLLAGAAGLIAGLAWPPIGTAAGAALVVYFVLAIAAHVRAADYRNLPVPVVMELLAVASLAL